MSDRALLFTLLLLATTLPAGAQNALGMRIGKTTIDVTGLQPGSTAIVFGVSRESIPGAYMDRIERWEAAVDDVRRDGTATFDLGKDVPATSLWAVVDARNGHYATAVQGGAVVVPMRANPLRKSGADAVDRFSFDHRYLLLLYVHPGLGAWTWYAMDGARTDLDGSNGSTLVALADGKPLGTAGKVTKAFVPGGLLVAIDYVHFEAAVVHVDEALLGGAR